MAETPRGTPVGVDDPYDHVDRCDHCTDRGECRLAADSPHVDRQFARERRADDLRCPAADPDGAWDWADCPHFRCRDHARECARCGLSERRRANDDERPLLEEHHLSYADGATGEGEPGHEITVLLCRWCHAKIHDSWARLDDDVAPDAEAIAAAEGRRADEQRELAFESAAERFDRDGE